MTATEPSTGIPTTVYTGRTTNWLMVAVSSALGAALIAGGLTGDGSRNAFLLLVGLAGVGILVNVLTASSVRVAAGPNGFDLRWGVIGWPRCSVRLDEIDHVDVVDVPWWRVSWGYWWTPRRTTCTLRSGNALQLHLSTGRVVTATVPSPSEAAATLEAARAVVAGS